jgi:hypothetical protein
VKRIKVILTTGDDQEILKIVHPLFVAVVADRFVIDDQRLKPAAKLPVVKRRGKKP